MARVSLEIYRSAHSIRCCDLSSRGVVSIEELFGCAVSFLKNLKLRITRTILFALNFLGVFALMVFNQPDYERISIIRRKTNYYVWNGQRS